MAGGKAYEVDLSVVVDLVDAHNRPVPLGAGDQQGAGPDPIRIGGV